MSELITSTAKLLPRNKRVKPFPGFATAYHFDSIEQDAKLGSLYVVIEVLANPKQAEAVADLVIETLGNGYYNADAEEDDSKTVLTRFEDAIKATNHALSEYTNKGNASWVGRMSAVVAILVDSELHISQTGSAEAYLYRGNVTSHITADLHNKSQLRPINTFANIATGSLQLHDKLILATPAFFHQIQRSQLKSILNDSTATGATQKLSELISGNDEASRVALIIVELTTADLMAMQTRNSDAEVLEVGQPDKPMEIARAIAAPAAKSIVNTSKSVGAKAAEQAKTRVIPKVTTLGHRLASTIRTRLQTKKGRFEILGFIGILIALAVGLSLSRHKNTSQAQYVSTFDAIYQKYSHAQELAKEGNITGSTQALMEAKSEITNLKGKVNEAIFTTALKNHPHSESEPSSISELQTQITTLFDSFKTIVKLTTNQLVDLSTLKSFKPHFIELVGNKLVLGDSQGNSTFYTYDQSSKNLTQNAKTPTGFGHIVATTVSSDASGIYILTDKPSVWFFKAIDGTLTEQSLSFGTWPKGRALASYNDNIYELASDSAQLYKFSPTSAGFTAPVNYFSTSAATNGATAMTVDGSIYLAGGPTGLRRFTAGKLDASVPSLPSNLQSPSLVRSITNGDQIIMIDSKMHQLALFNSGATTMTLTKQMALDGYPLIDNLAANPNSTTIYLIAGGKLVSAKLP